MPVKINRTHTIKKQLVAELWFMHHFSYCYAGHSVVDNSHWETSTYFNMKLHSDSIWFPKYGAFLSETKYSTWKKLLDHETEVLCIIMDPDGQRGGAKKTRGLDDVIRKGKLFQRRSRFFCFNERSQITMCSHELVTTGSSRLGFVSIWKANNWLYTLNWINNELILTE